MTADKNTNPRRTARPRHDSNVDNRDTTSLPGACQKMSGQGREGGRLARDLGLRDELKRSEVADRAVAEIHKTLTNLPLDEIERQVARELHSRGSGEQPQPASDIVSGAF